MMQFPQQYEFSQPQLVYQVKARTDKNMLMLGFCIIGAVVLIIISVFFMIWLSKYVIDHKSNSVISGFLEFIVYMVLFFNFVYGVGVYFIAATEESVYRVVEWPVVYTSIAYLAVHIILPIIFLIMSSNPHYMALFNLLIFPDVVEVVVFGITAFGFYSLYKKSAYTLLPVYQL